jgi:hypothetical protein
MKIKCVTTLALSLQPRLKTIHKMYPRASQDNKGVSLSGKGPHHPPHKMWEVFGNKKKTSLSNSFGELLDLRVGS